MPTPPQAQGHGPGSQAGHSHMRITDLASEGSQEAWAGFSGSLPSVEAGKPWEEAHVWELALAEKETPRSLAAGPREPC